MTKQKQLTLKVDVQTALDLLEVLNTSTAGYSKEHSPERIIRLRELMVQLQEELT